MFVCGFAEMCYYVLCAAWSTSSVVRVLGGTDLFDRNEPLTFALYYSFVVPELSTTLLLLVVESRATLCYESSEL